MLAICAFIYLLKFATCLGHIPAPSAFYPPATMPDGQAATAVDNSSRASNFTKDRFGIEQLTALSTIKLNNRKVAA